jgi:hypothetical protein
MRHDKAHRSRHVFRQPLLRAAAGGSEFPGTAVLPFLVEPVRSDADHKPPFGSAAHSVLDIVLSDARHRSEERSLIAVRLVQGQCEKYRVVVKPSR